jgi:NAD(P)H-quinone oxidoreductase subunit 5
VPEKLADLVLALAVLAPVVGALTSTVRRARSGRTAMISTAVALVAAAVVLVAAGADAPAAWSFDGRLLVEADRLGALLLVFVLSATVVVQAYAVRSLRGDLCRHRFFLASGVAAGATATVVVAADLWVAVIAWIVVSLATVALLFHDGRPTARAAARRAARTFLVGDLALLGAAVVAGRSVGAVTLRPDQLSDLASSAPTAGPFPVVAVLAIAAVAAAVTRSALPPGHSWLPMSVAAPTPSSAVLHAGIVNGGGVLLVRFAPVLAVSWVATALAVAAGCAAVLVGTAVARTRADVKTGLAWSTVAQMGFMVTQCVTGLVGPALVHMVAHGMYKSNLFLGSGSTLAHTHPVEPDVGPRLGRAVLTAIVTVLSVGTAWAVVRPSTFRGAAGLVFAGFVAATVAQAAWAWMRARPGRTRLDLVALVGLVVATTAAVGVASAVKAWVAPSLPEVDPRLATAGALALAITGVLAVGLAVVARHARGPLAALTERAYLWSLHLGDPARLAPVTSRIEVRT